MSFRATNKHSCTKFFAISAIHLSFKRDIRRLRNFLVSKHLLDLMLNEVLAVIDYGICTMFSLFSEGSFVFFLLLFTIFYGNQVGAQSQNLIALGIALSLFTNVLQVPPFLWERLKILTVEVKAFFLLSSFTHHPHLSWDPSDPLDPSSIWSFVESSHSVQSIIPTAWIIKQKEETSIILLSHLIK